MVKKIEEALSRASFRLRQAGVEQPRTEVEILLSCLMNTDRLQLFLNRGGEISSEIDALFQDAVRRRTLGEPLAYITGEKYFYGFRFLVNKDVLIPRPETELIIDSALQWHNFQKEDGSRKISCIDLGTGSGVLAVTLALKLSEAVIFAVDHSGAALQVAKLNAEIHEVEKRINWHQGSYFDALQNTRPRPRFNLVISNPPYLSLDDMTNLPKEVREFEPAGALYGGEDGLDGYRAILGALHRHVQTPGLLLLEIGAGQQKRVEALSAKTGLFSSINWHCDLAGHPRVMEGIIREQGIPRSNSS